MDIKKLQKLVVDALEDVKAQDIKLYDTTGITALFDRVCIASGTSNRQTKALAAAVRDKVKENGGDIVGMEGEDIGEWVLVDLGDMVVHIMQPIIRGYYRLEELWGEKEVKLGAAKRTPKVSAITPSEDEEKPKRVRSAINQATQTTLDDEPKAKKTRAPRTTKATTTASDAPAKPAVRRKKAIGTTVKVAASKTAVASAKQAASKKVAAKRAPAKRKTSAAS